MHDEIRQHYNRMKFSVLISVYSKDNPAYFKKALESILNQTLLPNQVVIVKDGPVSKGIDEVIDLFSKEFTNTDIVPLSKNQGLAIALNEGLKRCKHEWIGRMDSDDYSYEQRFEKQIEFLKTNKEIKLLGTFYKEFVNEIDNVISSKSFPIEHVEILSYSKKRNPFHHSSVMFNREVVASLGGYDRELTQIQDYLLWCMILTKGYKTANLDDYLLFVRADNNFFGRRTGIKYLKREYLALKKIYETGHYSFLEFYRNMFVRSVIRLFPRQFLKQIYKKFLRN